MNKFHTATAQYLLKLNEECSTLLSYYYLKQWTNNNTVPIFCYTRLLKTMDIRVIRESYSMN